MYMNSEMLLPQLGHSENIFAFPPCILGHHSRQGPLSDAQESQLHSSSSFHLKQKC